MLTYLVIFYNRYMILYLWCEIKVKVIDILSKTLKYVLFRKFRKTLNNTEVNFWLKKYNFFNKNIWDDAYRYRLLFV